MSSMSNSTRILLSAAGHCYCPQWHTVMQHFPKSSLDTEIVASYFNFVVCSERQCCVVSFSRWRTHWIINVQAEWVTGPRNAGVPRLPVILEKQSFCSVFTDTSRRIKNSTVSWETSCNHLLNIQCGHSTLAKLLTSELYYSLGLNKETVNQVQTLIYYFFHWNLRCVVH